MGLQGTQVDCEQSPVERLAEAAEVFDRLGSLQRSDDARHCAEYALRDPGTGAKCLPVGIEIAVTTAFPAVENGHLTVKLPDRAVHPGFSAGGT